MSRIVRTMRKATRARITEIEAMRTQLPLQDYLMLLHTAATTGIVPRIDTKTRKIITHADGTPVGDELEGKEQIALLVKLVDKGMPTPKITFNDDTTSQMLDEDDDAADAKSVKTFDAERVSEDELHRIAEMDT